MAVIDNDRYDARELETEAVAQPGAGVLKEKRALLGQELLAFVVINVEMGGLQHFPVERLVLDLVLSKGKKGAGAKDNGNKGQEGFIQ